jgi:membrane protein YdbS with pleckstrin-like domain
VEDGSVTETEPRLRAPANHVSARARTYWTVRALAAWLVVGVVETFICLSSSQSTTVVIVAVTVPVAALHLIVMPRWRFRVHRWEATDTAVYTQSGWLNQERRIAPIARIQTVDTERGPFEQLFGLANVTVTTASAAGPLKIHGLDRSVADTLVEELTVRTQVADEDGT